MSTNTAIGSEANQPTTTTKTVKMMHGIKFIFIQTGSIARFDMQNMLFQLAAVSDCKVIELIEPQMMSFSGCLN